MDKLLNISPANIFPDPNQPRKDFDEEKLQELADSIRAAGVVQPITVRPGETESQYMLIAGERRWRASRIAGIETIPSVVVSNEESLTDESIFKIQLTENFEREDLNPVEEAEFLQQQIDKLKTEGNENPADIVVNALGKSRSWLSKKLKVLKHSEEIRMLAREGLVRDYSILNKLEKCSTEKKSRAIKSIKEGSFNAKEFFSRKRYDGGKKNSVKTVSGKTKDVVRENKFQILFSKEGIINLIDKTEYRHILDSSDPDWKMANDEMMKAYLHKFKEWAVDKTE